MKSAALAAFILLAGAAIAADPAPGCSAAATAQWASAGEGFMIEGSTVGPDCAKAVALIVARQPDGTPIWVEAFVTAQVMVLAGAQSPDDMKPALGDWVDQRSAMFKTTSDLPEWKEGADSPSSGEFPFYPAEGIDRAAYNAIRASGSPLFCYVQGMESMTCVAMDKESGGASKIGVQTFPG